MTHPPKPEATDPDRQAGVIDDARCLELVHATPVGRIGFMSEGVPLVLPVNHAVVDGTIVFRTVEGQKLAAAAANQPVCFEVDQWDAEHRTGWSVVLQGRAREVTNWAEQEQLEGIGLTPWVTDEWRRMWVRIEPTLLTGREFG